MTDELLSRVLVPLNGSPNAERILPPLRRLLSPDDSSVTLLQALSFVNPSAREDADRYLWKVAFDLRSEGFRANYAIRFGPPAETVLEEAAARGSTLIALATHGRSGLQRLVLGSVAEKLLQLSDVPVLLTRSFPSAAAPENPAAVAIRNVLLPLDESPEALDALKPILAVARRMDARIHLLEVGEDGPYPGHWESPDESAKKAEQVLREACIPTTFERLHGNPAEEILRAASQYEADLIVMSTHGRSGPALWLKGSVTADVLQRTTVPMLVVRRQSRGTLQQNPVGAMAQDPAQPADNSVPVLPPA
jgi:nucleotide-binding universal stress UspA family protein